MDVIWLLSQVLLLISDTRMSSNASESLYFAHRRRRSARLRFSATLAGSCMAYRKMEKGTMYAAKNPVTCKPWTYPGVRHGPQYANWPLMVSGWLR